MSAPISHGRLRTLLLCATPLALAALSVAQSSVPLVVTRDGRLLGHDTLSNDDFGSNVAISGDTAVVGAGLSNNSTGAAYVFVRTASGWVEQAKLIASDAVAGDLFGASVAIEGDRIVVSSLKADVGGVPDTGALYVFERSGTTWPEVQKLVGIGADISEGVGWSLALDGDTLVAGAADDHHSGGQFDGGAAYVFVRGASGWTQQQRVIAGDGQAFDYFGHAVALEGDTLVVGAYSDNHSYGANGGSAYVFTRSGSTWSLLQKIVPADNSGNDNFGFAVALEGDTLVAGAIGDAPSGSQFQVGSIYVFTRSPSGFVQTQKTFGSSPMQYGSFGSSLALQGDTLIVGSPSGDSPLGSFTGSVQVMQRGLLGFATTFELRSTVIEQGAYFGWTVALDGERALVGAPFDDTLVSGDNSGSVYAYELGPAVEIYCTAKVNSQGCVPALSFSGLPSMSSASAFDVDATNVLNQKNGLLFYGLSANAAPFQGGTMCVAAPVRRTQVQNSGGSASGSDCSGSYAFDFNAYLQSGVDGELFSGAQVYAQFWSRDPLASFGTGLTDAIHFHVLP